MSRPEKTISGIAPVAGFARQLQLLRRHAALTRTEHATATLSIAAAGREMPPSCPDVRRGP